MSLRWCIGPKCALLGRRCCQNGGCQAGQGKQADIPWYGPDPVGNLNLSSLCGVLAGIKASYFEDDADDEPTAMDEAADAAVSEGEDDEVDAESDDEEVDTTAAARAERQIPDPVYTNGGASDEEEEEAEFAIFSKQGSKQGDGDESEDEDEEEELAVGSSSVLSKSKLQDAGDLAQASRLVEVGTT